MIKTCIVNYFILFSLILRCNIYALFVKSIFLIPISLCLESVLPSLEYLTFSLVQQSIFLTLCMYKVFLHYEIQKGVNSGDFMHR